MANKSAERFGMIPADWQPLLKGNALRTYVALMTFRNAISGRCDPSRAAIAKLAGIDLRAVTRALGQLKQMGAICIDFRHNKSSSYRFQTRNEAQAIEMLPKSSAVLTRWVGCLKARGFEFRFADDQQLEYTAADKQMVESNWLELLTVAMLEYWMPAERYREIITKTAALPQPEPPIDASDAAALWAADIFNPDLSKLSSPDPAKLTSPDPAELTSAAR